MEQHESSLPYSQAPAISPYLEWLILQLFLENKCKLPGDKPI
jgi:hypothetical protein